LIAISRAYADRTGHTLEVGLAKETSGFFKKGMIALVTPLPEFYAEVRRLNNFIKLPLW
jgi:hypothetical protein